jgi:hypothetical protein
MERDGGGRCPEAEGAARNGGIVGEALVNEFIAHAVEASCFSVPDSMGEGAQVCRSEEKGAMEPR